MTFSALSRRILSLLMVCVLLFVCSPIRAEALALETVLLAAPVVIAAIFIGIGIFEITGTKGFQNAVDACVDFLGDTTDFIADASVECLAYYNEGQKLIHAVDVQLVEAVRQWAVESGLITVETVKTHSYGFTRVATSLGTEHIVRQYWDTVPIYELVNNSDSGILLCAEVDKSFYGIALNPDGFILSVVLDSIAPYTSENFPCGEFIPLEQFTGNIDGPGLNNLGTLIFYNYELAYDFWKVTSGTVYYLTEDTVFSPEYTSGSSFRAACSFESLGRISPNGQVDVGISVDIYYGHLNNSWIPNALVPTETITKEYIGNGVGLGQFVDPGEDVYAAYPLWAQNAIASGNVNYIPLGTTSNYDDISRLIQDDIWTGNVFAAEPLIYWEEDWEYQTYYDLGDIPSPLFCKAYSPDGGTLTYQWYCDARPIKGEQTAVFYPPTSEVGEHVYNCLVTNIVTKETHASYAWSLNYQIIVSDVGVEVGPTVGTDVDADAFQDSISDAITDYDSMQGVLDGGGLPSYSDIDPSFDDIFGNDGIGLATDALKEMFGGYIFRVFFIAFMLGSVSFVVFGKRS